MYRTTCFYTSFCFEKKLDIRFQLFSTTKSTIVKKQAKNQTKINKQVRKPN